MNAEYVFEHSAEWSKEKAKEMFNIILSTGRKFNCVIAISNNKSIRNVDAFNIEFTDK